MSGDREEFLARRAFLWFGGWVVFCALAGVICYFLFGV